MMVLLYETVPAFEDTWIECLGDLGRYRIAIEDDDIRDRKIWTGVARHWYSQASGKAPSTGRLYHHLAILARPNALQQLFYYAKSLCVQTPFTFARESVLTLFEPVLNADHSSGQYHLPPLDMVFIKAHGLLFTGREMKKFRPTVDEFLGLLDSQIGRVTRKFMQQGYHIAIANNVAMLGSASKDNVLIKATPSPKSGEDVPMTSNTIDEQSQSMISFKHAESFSNSTLKSLYAELGIQMCSLSFTPPLSFFTTCRTIMLQLASYKPTFLGISFQSCSIRCLYPTQHLAVSRIRGSVPPG